MRGRADPSDRANHRVTHWLCVAALVVAIGLALLAGAALVGLGWLAWRVWLAPRDRRDPPEAGRAAPFDQWRASH